MNSFAKCENFVKTMSFIAATINCSKELAQYLKFYYVDHINNFFREIFCIIFIPKFSHYFSQNFHIMFIAKIFAFFRECTKCENKVKRSRKIKFSRKMRLFLFAGNPIFSIYLFTLNKVDLGHSHQLEGTLHWIGALYR